MERATWEGWCRGGDEESLVIEGGHKGMESQLR